jgi:Family of unknown function (DUF6900)
MAETNETRAPHSVIAKIAREVLGLETIETRGRDGLDFSEQAVWSLREALEAAYRAGVAQNSTKPSTSSTTSDLVNALRTQ